MILADGTPMLEQSPSIKQSAVVIVSITESPTTIAVPADTAVVMGVQLRFGRPPRTPGTNPKSRIGISRSGVIVSGEIRKLARMRQVRRSQQ